MVWWLGFGTVELLGDWFGGIDEAQGGEAEVTTAMGECELQKSGDYEEEKRDGGDGGLGDWVLHSSGWLDWYCGAMAKARLWARW
ncbi:hypothetical protein M0R45_002459 [Rubus argutus]|uniref:Uncharacterized protein n=1 Tax=Rubus argutus TaxID=59490 RepID=A0AAW1VRH6_RUBAR